MIRKKNYILVIQFGEDGVSNGAFDFETDDDAEAERVYNFYLDSVKRHSKRSPRWSWTVSWNEYGTDEDGYLTEERKRFEVVKKEVA